MTPLRTRSAVARQLLLATAVIGCGAAGYTWPAHAQPSTTQTPDARTCGAFAAVNYLAHESLSPAASPDPAFHRDYDLVGLANALDNVDKSGVSSDLNSAAREYIYALAERGAEINHHESTDHSGLDKSEQVMVNRCGPTALTEGHA